MRGGDGTGSIAVSGISGTVSRAFLYWNGPTNSTIQASNARGDIRRNAGHGDEHRHRK